jgi:hypothetical protein
MKTYVQDPRRRNKTEIALLTAKMAAESGRRVVYATLDQETGIRGLQRVMPGALVEVISDTFLVPHPKKGR